MVWKSLKMWAALTALLLLEGVLPPMWGRPDFVLLFLVPFSLRFGRYHGAIFGFISGFTLGCVGASVGGALALTYSLVGYLLGWWGEREVPNWFVKLLGMLFAVAAVELILGSISRLSPWDVAPSVATLRFWLLPTMLVNIALLWPMDSLARLLLGRVSYENMRWRI